ncbi:MAG TPA: sigma-70 family RNA polymerase sigma factor [Mycobacteriales bacterium]
MILTAENDTAGDEHPVASGARRPAGLRATRHLTLHTVVSPPSRVPVRTVGDGDAFLRTLYATYGGPLLAYVSRLTADVYQAEDVVQETMVRAWRRADRLTPEHGSVWGWLTRVARNIVVDKVRARRARPTEVEESADRGWPVEDHAEAIVTAVFVARALARLIPAHRAVLQQVYFHDRTAAEAALALGIPVGTVKSRLHYAMANLRLLLEAERVELTGRPAVGCARRAPVAAISSGRI